MPASENLVKAIMATAQLMGTDLTADAARMFCADLCEYDEPAVLRALTRCRREVRGRLTLAEVIARIDDGRPGADEAWAMIPRSERDTVVWTEEMRAAWAVAAPLAETDEVGARMAFRDTYTRAVTEARAARRPVDWSPSLGWDKACREPVIRAAVERGRLSREQALKLLPSGAFSEHEPSLPRLEKPLPYIEAATRAAHQAEREQVLGKLTNGQAPDVMPSADAEQSSGGPKKLQQFVDGRTVADAPWLQSTVGEM